MGFFHGTVHLRVFHTLNLNSAIMRVLSILSAAAMASAFVLPDQATLESLAIEEQKVDKPQEHPFWNRVHKAETFWEDLEEEFTKFTHCAKHKFEEVVESTQETAVKYGEQFHNAFAGDAWLESAEQDLDLLEHPPHHGPPHHPPGKNPKHAPKPPKEFLKKLLTYHVSEEFYPAGRVLVSRTIPTALQAEYIGKVPQRISSQISLRGLTLNFYARVVAIDIFGTNGVVHGIDSFLLPPPKVVDILSALPGEFSTLDLALEKTGLFSAFNDTSSHKGGTLFAPSNFAFKRLGPRINAFLFSRFGLRYLKALVLYHAGDNITLYSDAIYKIDTDAHPPHHKVPKGFIHVDMPTGLEDKSLSIDIARYGRLITMKINGFTRVSVLDGIAADGVLHIVPNVLISPKPRWSRCGRGQHGPGRIQGKAGSFCRGGGTTTRFILYCGRPRTMNVAITSKKSLGVKTMGHARPPIMYLAM